MTAPPSGLTDEQIASFVYLQQQINLLAWLHSELVYQLQQLMNSQQALIRRAKAVRLATQKNNARNVAAK